MIKETDPLSTALVFNCGMGAVRTTFAMVAACIVRRKQLIDRGLEDPYSARSVGSRSGMSTVSAMCLHSVDVTDNYLIGTSPPEYPQYVPRNHCLMTCYSPIAADKREDLAVTRAGERTAGHEPLPAPHHVYPPAGLVSMLLLM